MKHRNLIAFCVISAALWFSLLLVNIIGEVSLIQKKKKMPEMPMMIKNKIKTKPFQFMNQSFFILLVISVFCDIFLAPLLYLRMQYSAEACCRKSVI